MKLVINKRTIPLNFILFISLITISSRFIIEVTFEQLGLRNVGQLEEMFDVTITLFTSAFIARLN